LKKLNYLKQKSSYKYESRITNYGSRKIALSLGIIFTFILSPFLSLTNVLAADLADNNDIFEIVAPSPNQTVSGTIQIRVRAFDDDQSNIQFTSRLFDRATCHDQPFGSVTSLSQIPSNSSQTYSFNWNTTRTTNISSIDDGAYCLETCLYLQNGSSPYSACKSRTVNIRNNNRNPIISSQPSKLIFNEGDRFYYQIVASDPDGDRLSYRFITTNDQFAINQNGLVTSNPLSTNGANSVSIPIRIAVNDPFGGEAQQSFTVVVNRVTGEEEPDNEEEPDDDNEEEPDDEEPTEDQLEIDIENFQFIIPKKDNTFSENAFFIEWENLNSNLPLNLELSFKRTEADEWSVISNDITNEQNYFLWDVKNIDDGEYQVRISFLDEEEQVVRLVSDVFKINREDIDDETDVEQIPLIKNVKPENNAVLDVASGITISGEFLPSEGAEILVDQVEIKLDGRIISPNCEVTQTTFSCPVEGSLPAGRHIISVKITDSVDKSNELESIFRIDLENQPPASLSEDEGPSADEINILGINIAKSTATLIGLICLIAGILLFVPWILYSFWVRDRSKEIKTTTYVNEPPQDLSTENLPNVNVFIPENQPVYPQTDLNIYNPDGAEQVPHYTNDYNVTPVDTTVAPIQPYVAPAPYIQPTTPDVNVNVNMPEAQTNPVQPTEEQKDDQFVEPTMTS
jgi:hypothetical protein